MSILPDLSQVNPKKEHKEMMTVSPEDGRFVVKTNSSSLALILECARKSYYTIARGLRSKAESSATIYGTAIHKALEVYYSSPLADRKLPSDFKQKMEDMEFNYKEPQENIYLKAAAAFVESMSELKHLEHNDKRSIPTGLWTLYHYFNAYLDDPLEVYCDSEGPIIERKFEFTLAESEEITIKYFGQIDVVLKNTTTDSIYVADHKTTSVLGQQFLQRLKPNHQYTGYVMAAKEALGIDTEQFMVNAIQVKAKPKTARGSAPNFSRQFTRRDHEDCEEFKRTVTAAVVQYLEWLNADFFPMGNVNACSMYNGCQFLEVCSSQKSIRENIIDAKFEEIKCD